MRIGIDARLLSRWRGGSSVFLKQILLELKDLDRENEYFLYSNRPFVLPIEGVRWHSRVWARFAFMPGTLWVQTDLKAMIREDRLDVFWGAMQAIPLGKAGGPVRVLTVYDLIWVVCPGVLPFYTSVVFRLFDRRYANQADRLIAISEATARDLERLYHIPRSKTEVIHLGARREYKPTDRCAAARAISRKFNVSEEYICTVGTVQPRKNVETLIRAVKLLRSQGVRHQLVVAGARGWKNSRIYSSVKELGLTDDDVRFLGYVPDSEMPSLYAGAALFAFPSLCEGFGIPLVEAMASGTPIVASEAPPVPEIVGDAAIMVSPKSAPQFAGAISRVLSNPDLRACMVAKGLERSNGFRWDIAARRMLDAFRRFSSREQQACD
jgi:glycosyltransferase involved in cell wall biosynthesis